MALQLRQEPRSAFDAMRYSPTAHVDVHVPALESNVAPSTHVVQPVALPSEQVAHEAWQLTHVLLASANLFDGQESTHVLSSKSDVPLDGQVRHPSFAAPAHVSHDE